MERMQALIGHFDLDPTRTLDILLDVFSDNIVHHHVFFRDLLRHSPWGRSASEHGGDKMSKQEPDGGLGDSSGDFICAQVLGFKFAVYQVRLHKKSHISPSIPLTCMPSRPKSGSMCLRSCIFWLHF